jgi:small-conductance mechanosensitive channel
VARVRLLVLVLLVAAALVRPGGVYAAEGDPPPASEPAPQAESTEQPDEPRPIAVTEVPRQAARATEDLRPFEPPLSPSDEETAIRGEFDRLKSAEEELEKLPASINPDAAPPWLLEDAEDEWERVSRQLDAWFGTITELASRMNDQLGAIERSRIVWRLTRESAEEQEFPEALVVTVEELQAKIREAEEALRQRRDEILTLENALAVERIRARGVLDRIRAARSEARQRIFAPDAPPLWRAIAGARYQSTLLDQIAYAWDKNGRELREYAQQRRDLIFLHGVLTLLLLGGMIGLARAGRRWASEDDALAVPAKVLSKPVSATLVVSLTVGVPLHTGAPTVVFELMLFVLAVPLLWILPGLVYQEIRWPLFALTGIFVLDRVRALTPDESLLHRLLLVVTTTLALLVCLVAVRALRSHLSTASTRWLRTTLFVARGGAAVLSISLLANLLGATALARLLTSATMVSSYMAVAILAGVLILDGAVVILIRTRLVRRSNVIRDHSGEMIRRVSRLLHVSAAGLWVYIALKTYDVWPMFWSATVSAFGHTWKVGSLEFALWQLPAFVVALYVSVQLSRLIRVFLEDDVLTRMELPRGVGGTISMLVRYAVLTIGFFVAVAAAGIDLSAFTIVAGALGVGIGFGLQNVVNNFVSGLILAFERPVQIGDTIEVAGLLGEVKNIGIRSSTVRTFEGAEVIVPNGDLIASQVTNWTLSDRQRRLQIAIGVAYGTDPSKVIELLNETAASHPEVLTDQPPYTLFLGFGDSSLNFELRVWTLAFDRWRQVQSEVTVAVNEALTEAGIEIPFPQRDLHLRSVDGDAAGTLAAGKKMEGTP